MIVLSRLLGPACGLLLLGYGLLAMAGWVFQWLAVVQPFPQRPYVTGFVAAFGLALVGVAVLMHRLRPQRRQRAQTAIGILLVLLGAAAALERLSGIDLGLALPALHGWFAQSAGDGALRPAYITALLLIGTTLVLMSRVRGRATAMAVWLMTVATGAIGLAGLSVHLIGLDFLYQSFGFTHMAPTTAVGALVASLGLWADWRSAPWIRAHALLRGPDERITFIATCAMLLVAVLATLATIRTMGQQAEEQAAATLNGILQARMRLFESVIDLRSARAEVTAARSDLAALMRAAQGNAQGVARERLAATAWGLVQSGFSAITFEDRDGHELTRGGSPTADPELAVTLAGHRSRELLWYSGLRLRSRMPVSDGDGLAGFVVTEQWIPGLVRSGEPREELGETGETVLCARGMIGMLDCFPVRFRPRPFQVEDHDRLPVARALAGRAGVSRTTDYRRQQVLAAHAPVGDLGLGMVAKMDTAEIYQPIASTFRRLLTIVPILLLLGAALVHAAVRPLARRLAINEARVRLAMKGSRLAMWDWERRTGSVYLSAQWRGLLGEPATEAHTELAGLLARLHPEDRAAFRRALRPVLRARMDQFDIELRLRGADGSWIWVRTRGEVAARDRRGRALRAAGTTVDITRRQQAEQSLRRRSRTLQAVIDAMPSGVVVTTSQGLMMNPAARRMLALGPTDPLPSTLAEAAGVHGYRKRGADADAFEFRVQPRGASAPHWISAAIRPITGDASEAEGTVAVWHDITDRKRAAQALADLAHLDTLTGLPNRRALEERLDGALAHAAAAGGLVALLYTDLDRFKAVNDTWGHDAGDIVLQAVAQRLRAVVRASDTVARLGGDEFVVLLDGLHDAAEAAQVAVKIVESMRAPVTIRSGVEAHVGASVGIALHRAGEDAARLLKRADAALYQAKHAGRDRWQMAA